MPLQGDYEPSRAKWVRDQVEEYESSGGTRGTTLRGVPVVVITSIGASSGKLRKNPVMRVEHDGVYAAVASRGGAPENPAWYRNIVEHPDIELQDGPSKGDYVAREAAGDERDFWWSRAVEVWPDYAQYQTKTERQIPVLVLEPAHWGAVGGLWREIGQLQFRLMVDEGLTPRHRLLDVGCGSMRGGVHFIRHLDAGHYVGVDVNAELLEAGRSEIARAGLEEKRPMLVHRGDFEFRDLGVFDFAIAQSLFTHLPFNSIVRCLARTAEVLRPGGRLLATFFANSGSRLRTEPLVIHARDGLVLTINLDNDPFYYVPELFEWLCEGSDLSCEYRGEWGHPRDQHLLAFTKRS